MKAQRRFRNLIGILGALLLLAQATLPVSAFAEITMRCADARSQTVVCKMAVVPQADVKASRFGGSAMPCCRTDMGCMKLYQPGRAVRPAELQASMGMSSRHCQVTIVFVNSETAARNLQSGKRQLGSASSLAPSSIMAAKAFLPLKPFNLRPIPLSVASSTTITSHGLRAPPLT